MIITPEPLKKGDTIAIASPAGAVREPLIVEQAADVLRSRGYNVVTAPHCLTRNGYYSGTREERASDFAALITDNNIKAILCSYGGYGCVHLLDELSPLIARHPKWIIGMSDCSALHAACVASGVQSIHAPQCRHIAQHPHHPATEALFNILAGNKPHYKTAPHRLNIQGTAQGCIAGGNLSVIAGLAGSNYDIFTEGRIVFIEDTGELPYRVERLMYQLKLSGALGKIKGLIVGQFNGVKEHTGFGGTTQELIHNIIKDYGIPVCFNFPVGHCEDNFPLIEGCEVTLSVGECGSELTFEMPNTMQTR